MVAFDFSEKYNKEKTGRKTSKSMVGMEASFHDTFGLKAEELAALMTDFKVRYERKGG
jgi:hypothetical protein